MALGAVALLGAAFFAPVGYQDESGFHMGSAEQGETATVTDRELVLNPS